MPRSETSAQRLRAASAVKRARARLDRKTRRVRKSRRVVKLRDNPTLAILGNPPRILSHNVHSVAYTHRADGRDYKHEFGPDVVCYLLPNGDVLLRHKRGKTLWQEFPE